jgi:hypothetical protein
MRVFSWITGGLLLAIVGLFVYQNLPTFNGLLPFSLDFHIHAAFTWSHRVYTVIGMAAFLGFLLGLVVMLKPYLKMRRMLKEWRNSKDLAQAQQQPQETKTDEEAPQTLDKEQA